MIHVAEANCSRCSSVRTIVHKGWDGSGGRLMTPCCEHCGVSWGGYGFSTEVVMTGQAVIWNEK